MRVTATILTITAIVALSGCATQQPYANGVVGWSNEFSEGSFAPDIPFTLEDGGQTTLHDIREPITILVFVNPWDDMYCVLRPDLLLLRKEFHVLPVTVVQILLPEGECLHGSGCSDVRNFDKYDIISLCDTNRVAWNAYGQPKPNTVILVDQLSKIVEIQNTDNLKKLAEKTYWMARNLYY